MSLWQCSIALVLGLVWYLSDGGRTVSQYLVCFVLCLCSPLLFGNSGTESATQTEEESEETPLQVAPADDVVDRTDKQTPAEPLETQFPHVKKSLQQVFECAYGQLVLPWYTVPEPCKEQPLYQALNRAVDFVIDRIIERARALNICQAVVGSIRILTQHLHNAKQSDRAFLFYSRAEEVAVLREFSDALVRNLFPESLWGQEVNRCALSEIIAVKGLGVLVTWLSDPDNLNQLVVSQLDSVSPKSSTSELYGLDPDQISLTSHEGAAEESSEVGFNGAKISNDIRIKGKRKCNKLKKGWSKFMDKMKSKKTKKKKMKKMEQELVMRIMSIQGDVSIDNDAISREGSINTQEDSDKEDSDLENYLASVQEDMMEFKLSYEMWRVGHWAVSISYADWEDEELTFTVHIEEKDSPENLQWDIKKTYMDVIYFRNRWQDSTSLPVILTLDESEIKKELVEEVRVSVEHFLQELVMDNLIGHTQPVFQFLCPLDKLLNEEEHYGGVWGLLSGLAYFLTPGYEEEEISISQFEAQGDSVPSRDVETAAMSLGNQSTSVQKEAESFDAPLPTVTSSFESKSELAWEAAAQSDPQSTVHINSRPQGKKEDSDNPLTSHLKTIFKADGRWRSQESLGSTKSDDNESSDSDCSQDKDFQHESTEGLSWLQLLSTKPNKKEKISFRVSCGPLKTKIKDTQGTLQRGDESQYQSQVNWEQLEATKAIFDLLKEISGNSIILNIFDAILKPVMPILKKKVNSFLNKMNPTEVQMAAYIDALCKKQWPETPPSTPSPSRTDEEKDETRERAHNLINTKYSNILVLKKTDVESVFNLFQDREENKTLVYMLLSFLIRELLPNEHSLNVSAAALQRVTTSIS